MQGVPDYLVLVLLAVLELVFGQPHDRKLINLDPRNIRTEHNKLANFLFLLALLPPPRVLTVILLAQLGRTGLIV